MKTVIVIILSLLLVLSVGLLAYGATLSNRANFAPDLGDLLPPVAPDEYAHDIALWIEANLTAESAYGRSFLPGYNPHKDPARFAAEVDGWFDVFGKHDPASCIPARYSGAELVSHLMVPVTYNNNRSKHFRMASHFEIHAGGDVFYSDNFRVREQPEPFAVDAFYVSRFWGGSPTRSSASIRAYYNDQKLEFVGFGVVKDYDEITGEYDLSYGKPTLGSCGRGMKSEFPRETYNLLTLPIYLGETELDCSVVDGATVRLTEPTDEKPYYTLTFSENLATAQTEENLNARLNAALGSRMSEITLKKADFVVEIWESGVFRQVTADLSVSAKIGGKKGDGAIKMTYKFYYDDASTDVIALIDSVGWTTKLSPQNQAEIAERKAKKAKLAAA